MRESHLGCGSSVSHVEYGRMGHYHYFESCPFVSKVYFGTYGLCWLYDFYRGKQPLIYLSEQLEGNAFWLLLMSLILWFSFPSVCFIHSVYLYLVDWGQEVCQNTHSHAPWHSQQGQVNNECFVGFLMSRPWRQLRTDVDVLCDSKESPSTDI